MYVIADRLMSAGLVTIFAHRGIMHAQAVAVSTLSSLLEKKQKDIEDAKRLP